jgi:hypothetical protein
MGEMAGVPVGKKGIATFVIDVWHHTILKIISVLFVDKQECLKNSTDCQVSNCNKECAVLQVSELVSDCCLMPSGNIYQGKNFLMRSWC